MAENREKCKKGADDVRCCAVKDTELRPCPFCGEEAKVIQIPNAPDDIRSGMWAVGCDGAFGSICPGYRYKLTPFYATLENAVRMWNLMEG